MSTSARRAETPLGEITGDLDLAREVQHVRKQTRSQQSVSFDFFSVALRFSLFKTSLSC